MRLAKHALCLAVALLIALAPAAWALDPATTGVVLLHGKWGDPSQMRPMGEALEEAGFKVERPAMPWAGYRDYDRSYGEAMAEIADAVARLKALGATAIVVGGQSLGGNATLGFATTTADLTAIMLVAPAHFPESERTGQLAGASVAKAQAMVAEGNGGDSASFIDLNSGNRTRWQSMPASRYLSYYDPQGPAAMSLAAPSVKVRQILWLPATEDPAGEEFAALVVPRLPAGTRLTRHDLAGGHLDAPEAAARVVVDMLKAVPAP